MNLLLRLVGMGMVGLVVACSGERKENEQKAVQPADLAAAQQTARARAIHRIDSLEAEIRKAIQTPEKAPNVTLAMHMIKAYHYFALDFPQDPRAPQALDRAGQLYAGVLGDYGKAVEFYEKAYGQYPTYKKRPNLLFQEAAAYDAAGDTTATAGTYQRLFLTYPDHPLAKEARQLLHLMRMTPAQQKAFFSQQEASARK